MSERRRSRAPREERAPPPWNPKTKLGASVAEGKVASLMEIFENGWRIKEPEIPAVINIDGASPLHGIMHMLGEVDPKQVKIGMRVQAVWKPAEDRQGSINDILYFKPLEEKY